MHCCPDQTSSCIWWHHTLAHSHSPGTWAQLLMVCAKCEKKLAKVACPDKWKEGSSNTIESGGRKINENKLLSKSKRWVADQWPGPGQWRLRDPCSSMNTWLTSGSGHAAAAAACTGQQQPGAVAGHRGGDASGMRKDHGRRQGLGGSRLCSIMQLMGSACVPGSATAVSPMQCAGQVRCYGVNHTSDINASQAQVACRLCRWIGVSAAALHLMDSACRCSNIFLLSVRVP